MSQQPNPNLQVQITALAKHYGPDTTGLAAAVSTLLKTHQPPRPMQAFPPAYSTPASQSQAHAYAQPSGSGSGTSTPSPATSSRGRVLKATKPYQPPAPVPRAITPVPSLQPSLAQSYRPSSSLNPNAYRVPTRIPLSSAATPVPPLSRISDPRYQALHTTYPARMRLGTSSLVQPNFLSASGTGSNTPGGAAGKRARNQINYAEIEGIEESEDDRLGLVPKRVLALQGGGGDKVWGDGKSYLGVLPPGNLVIVQPAKVTKHTPFSEDQLEEQADEPVVLVPIQIDIDVDTFKIRDSFVWNLNEKLITPESFAKVFCDDLDLPQTWVAEVAKQITEQVDEQTGVAEIAVRGQDDEQNHVEKDLRVVLNLDVQIGTLHLVDRIEWDLSSPLTPELFASVLVRDLSLSSSASPLISHALHEELYRHKKNCLEMGLVGEDAETQSSRRRGAKQLEGVWREWNETSAFGPRVEVLSLDEMDRVEADRERAIRRAKRDRLAASRTAGRRR